MLLEVQMIEKWAERNTVEKGYSVPKEVQNSLSLLEIK